MTPEKIMAGLVILLIIIACALYQYLKGNTIRSAVAIISAVCGVIVAFSYFELLANIFIAKADESEYPSVALWAQPLCFILLFVLVFVILQTAISQLTQKVADSQQLLEKISRTICGFILGLVISGVLLVALDMAPLSTKYPYTRFDSKSTNAQQPSKVFLNTDGLVTGWFSLISRGSLSGKKSFTAMHPSFVNQSFLNRLGLEDDVSILTSKQAIEIPKTNAIRLAPENLKDSKNKLIDPKTGHTLTILRIGIKKRVKNADVFTLSQLRLMCKAKANTDNPLAGSAVNAYPIGYLNSSGEVLLNKADDIVKLKWNKSDGAVKWVDFVFYVPENRTPTLAAFKQNSIAKLPKGTGQNEPL